MTTLRESLRGVIATLRDVFGIFVESMAYGAAGAVVPLSVYRAALEGNVAVVRLWFGRVLEYAADEGTRVDTWLGTLRGVAAKLTPAFVLEARLLSPVTVQEFFNGIALAETRQSICAPIEVVRAVRKALLAVCTRAADDLLAALQHNAFAVCDALEKPGGVPPAVCNSVFVALKCHSMRYRKRELNLLSESGRVAYAGSVWLSALIRMDACDPHWDPSAAVAALTTEMLSACGTGSPCDGRVSGTPEDFCLAVCDVFHVSEPKVQATLVTDMCMTHGHLWVAHVDGGVNVEATMDRLADALAQGTAPPRFQKLLPRAPVRSAKVNLAVAVRTAIVDAYKLAFQDVKMSHIVAALKSHALVIRDDVKQVINTAFVLAREGLTCMQPTVVPPFKVPWTSTEPLKLAAALAVLETIPTALWPLWESGSTCGFVTRRYYNRTGAPPDFRRAVERVVKKYPVAFPAPVLSDLLFKVPLDALCPRKFANIVCAGGVPEATSDCEAVWRAMMTEGVVLSSNLDVPVLNVRTLTALALLLNIMWNRYVVAAERVDVVWEDQGDVCAACLTSVAVYKASCGEAAHGLCNGCMANKLLVHARANLGLANDADVGGVAVVSKRDGRACIIPTCEGRYESVAPCPLDLPLAIQAECKRRVSMGGNTVHCALCGCVVAPRGQSATVVRCGVCSGKTCVTCRNAMHPGIVCPAVLTVNPTTLLSAVKQQACPACARPTTKDRECNHMRCPQPCGAHWCWQCGGAIDNMETHYAEDGSACVLLQYDVAFETRRMERALQKQLAQCATKTSDTAHAIEQALVLLHSTFKQTASDL